MSTQNPDYDDLAAYNSRCAQGIRHTEVMDKAMKELQAKFDNERMAMRMQREAMMTIATSRPLRWWEKIF